MLKVYLMLISTGSLIQIGAQTNWSISFLQELMRDPSKIASQEEALKQIEDIKVSKDVRSIVPVAFEAINSKSVQAQLYGASALFSVATRPDGPTVLGGEPESIMNLLTHSEPRLKITCVVLTQSVKLSSALYEQKFLKFLSNASEPMQVKPVIIGALVRGNSGIEEKMKVIGAFLRTEMPVQTRIEAYNAVASSPSDQTWHSDLVAIGLRDRDENVRQMTIGLLQRLGPNAVLRHSEVIRQLAISPTEPAKVRESAQRVLGVQ